MQTVGAHLAGRWRGPSGQFADQIDDIADVVQDAGTRRLPHGALLTGTSPPGLSLYCVTGRRRSGSARPTANIYVDGLNLYYGCLKGTAYKWLDLNALFETLLPNYDIKRIRYFTARISARPDNPGTAQRQDAYIRALRTLPNVSIFLGKFLVSTQRMPLADPKSGNKTVEVIKTEEKGSDVNIATYLLIDAFHRDSDLAVVVSNDSDLCEPIRIVKDEFKVPVGLLIPHSRTSEALRRLNPTFLKKIRGGPLSVCQFPDP